LTPRAAREASKRIVEDLLQSAGVGRGYDDDDDEEEDQEEDLTDDFADPRGKRLMMDDTSPSVVRKAASFEDESF
jgi:hypothetical protein